jgi:hypothetical protein
MRLRLIKECGWKGIGGMGLDRSPQKARTGLGRTAFATVGWSRVGG